MATPRRFVDSLPAAEKEEPIEVIVMGLSRTGTMSIYNALPQLGYNTYHMSEACKNAPKGSLIMWNEAITAKYGPSPSIHNEFSREPRPTPYGPADFAKLLSGYTATSDVPTALFLPELFASYPNAKLILTKHPGGVDGWLRSVKNSFYRVANWPVFDYLLIPFDKAFSRPYMTLIRRTMEIWTKTPFPLAGDFDAVEPMLRRVYVEHNEAMMALARSQGREALKFDPRMGWEPLCRFLGKRVPEGEQGYPHVNEGEYMVRLHRYLVWLRMKAVFGKWVVGVEGAVMVGGVAWWWVRR